MAYILHKWYIRKVDDTYHIYGQQKVKMKQKDGNYRYTYRSIDDLLISYDDEKKVATSTQIPQDVTRRWILDPKNIDSYFSDSKGKSFIFNQLTLSSVSSY